MGTKTQTCSPLLPPQIIQNAMRRRFRVLTALELHINTRCSIKNTRLVKCLKSIHNIFDYFTFSIIIWLIRKNKSVLRIWRLLEPCTYKKCLSVIFLKGRVISSNAHLGALFPFDKQTRPKNINLIKNPSILYIPFWKLKLYANWPLQSTRNPPRHLCLVWCFALYIFLAAFNKFFVIWLFLPTKLLKAV